MVVTPAAVRLIVRYHAEPASIPASRVKHHPHCGLHMFEFSSGAEVEAAVKALKADPNVAYVERNLLWQADAPDDKAWPALWALQNAGQTGGFGGDISILPAWNITKGAGVVVADIDTGIDLTHPDLAPALWTDVDGTHGFNAIAGNNNVQDDMTNIYHGSHTAGTMVAVGNNAQGIIGVAPEAKVMVLKFLDNRGSGSTTDAIECIEYILAKKAAGVNVVAVNASWGGGSFSQAMLDALLALNAADILFVASAGNNASSNIQYPAGYNVPNMLAVAATNHDDELAYFSNYGSWVHVAAPGVATLSCKLNGRYQFLNGTSMAAPHVTALAALVASLYPGISAAELKQHIVSSVDVLPQLAGLVASGGRINALAALGPIPPGLSLEVMEPTSQEVNQGEPASYAVRVVGIGGLSGPVDIAVSGVPDATVSLNPAAPQVGDSVVITITPSLSTPVATYPITITAQAGGLSDSGVVQLVVKPAGSMVVTAETNVAVPIPAGAKGGTLVVESPLQFVQPMSVNSATVHVSITVSGGLGAQVGIDLVHPDGQVVVLRSMSGQQLGSLSNMTFAPTTAFAGKQAAGTWKLRVTKKNGLLGMASGTIVGWSLTIEGVAT